MQDISSERGQRESFMAVAGFRGRKEEREERAVTANTAAALAHKMGVPGSWRAKAGIWHGFKDSYLFGCVSCFHPGHA